MCRAAGRPHALSRPVECAGRSGSIQQLVNAALPRVGGVGGMERYSTTVHLDGAREET